MGYYICTACGSVYDSELISNRYKDRDYNPCPRSECNGHIFECDELMIPAIMELNKKGYNTDCCCSGHMWGRGESYIQFNKYTFPDFKEPLPEPPKGWFWDEDRRILLGNPYTPICLQAENKYPDGIAKYQKILENMNELILWVNKLPDKEECL